MSHALTLTTPLHSVGIIPPHCPAPTTQHGRPHQWPPEVSSRPAPAPCPLPRALYPITTPSTNPATTIRPIPPIAGFHG